MAATNILGLHAHNFSNGDEKLVAVWEKTPMVYNGTQWVRGITLTDNTEAYMCSFMDRVILTNGVDANQEYNGVYWTSQENMLDSPIATYCINHSTRCFLYDVQIAGTRYRSRCWFSDLPNLDSFTWGFETASDLVQTAGSETVTSATANFQKRNIKIGDSFFITSGANARAKQYEVSAIDSDTSITLTEALVNSDTGSTYWTGGNWFDVYTDDGDKGMGLGMTSNEVVLFKKNSVHRINIQGATTSWELRRIKSAPGTTSPRSIVNSGNFVYWYHPTGIYRTDGTTGILISNAIEDAIEGVESGNQDNVVGWEDLKEKTINFYLGDVSLRDGDSITDCVAKFDFNAETWSFNSYERAIKCATPWIRNNVQKIYAGDDASGVYELSTGYDFNDSAIAFQLITKPIFPATSEAVVDFNRLRIYVENGPEIQVLYKLVYKEVPGEPSTWINESDWSPMYGSQRGPRSEWIFPPNCRASGVQLKIIESSTTEGFLLEKLMLYYSNAANY